LGGWKEENSQSQLQGQIPSGRVVNLENGNGRVCGVQEGEIKDQWKRGGRRDEGGMGRTIDDVGIPNFGHVEQREERLVSDS